MIGKLYLHDGRRCRILITWLRKDRDKVLIQYLDTHEEKVTVLEALQTMD